MTMFSWERLDLSVAGLLEHYRAGDFTPRELVAELRARSDLFRSHNIWIHPLSYQQLEPYFEGLQGHSPDSMPLYGIPFAIKDNIDLAGIPTTAACPEFSYTPERSATVVQKLIDAGAIPMGKTNLDQFATGLVGTRSPYGECRNALNADYISGGSSSGSAVATALGLVSFALGTDTAGSGRVPAAFNNLVGLKPSRGLISCQGVVPACRSLDCVTLFTLNSDDAATLLMHCEGEDIADPYSRANPQRNSPRYYGVWHQPFCFGVPLPEQRRFFGDDSAAVLFEQAIERLESLGGRAVEMDYQPLLDAAQLLYDGPWLAERYLSTETLMRETPKQMLPLIRQIISHGEHHSAMDVFAAQHKLQAFKQQADRLLRDVDCMLAPTTPTCYRRDTVNQSPVTRNSELGSYTNFMNLLDYAAIALPAGFLPPRVGWGITLFGEAFSDRRLLSISACYLNSLPFRPGVNLGTSFQSRQPAPALSGFVDLVVCGAHLSGMPLNWQLTERGGKLQEREFSAPCYRLYALADDKRPAMVHDCKWGQTIEVEVWRLPIENFGSFVAEIPPPLGIGKITLGSGRSLPGFIAEPRALENAKEITKLGSWRAYKAG